MSEENFVFFGDTKHMPYGEKTEQQLVEYSKYAFEFFEKLSVKAVVLACNTTSAVVYDKLNGKYNFKLYPLIQSVASSFCHDDVKTIGVFATPATINSHAYSKWISKYNKDVEVIEISCPEWVKMVENNDLQSTESKEYIKVKMNEMMQHCPGKIILGCTHYPYLLKELNKYAKSDIFVNPAKTYANIIREDLIQNDLLTDVSRVGVDMFFVSGSPEKFKVAGKMFYNLDEKMVLQLNDLFL